MSIQTLKVTSHSKDGWRRWIGSVADIADEVRDNHVESLPAGPYDFWFTPSLRPYHRQVNALATKILYMASDFSARLAPILCGVVVVTGRDSDGQLRSLRDEEMQMLVDFAYAPGLGMSQLELRLSRAVRREKRRRRAENEAVNRLRNFAY